jgi:hypothetical protein
MNVQPILQPILHEAYSVETAFFLHWIKHLDTNNFCKFHEFRELMVEDGIWSDFAPKFSH